VINIGPARNVLAHQHHFRVTPHFLTHGFVQRLAKIQFSLCHNVSPQGG
jgi:hypothetical protein